MNVDAELKGDARNARGFFAVVGGVFAMLTMLLMTTPTLNAPDMAAPGCAMVAVACFAIAWRATDHWVCRCQDVLLGWP